MGTLTEYDTNVVRNPVAIYRAQLAYLRGDREAARRFADEAIAYYRTGPWNERQQQWVRMKIALAEALAGRAEIAAREAQTAMDEIAARDAYDATILREEFGTVQLVLGRREEALATLRQILAGPCHFSPNELRRDPLWSRLKDDPRFEEILKSAKPL